MVFSAGALAQSLESEAFRVASRIRRDERVLSQSQKMEISRLLGEIRDVLGGDDDRGGEYTCVSRDNDGRSPYVMAVREGINVTRINGETYSSESECQENFRTIRSVGGSSLLCLSRDNDGRSPFVLGAISGTTLQRIQRTSVGSKQECLSLLNGLRVRGGTATMCIARDNDGRSPFVAASLDVRNLSLQVGRESFSSIAECNRFLGN